MEHMPMLTDAIFINVEVIQSNDQTKTKYLPIELKLKFL